LIKTNITGASPTCFYTLFFPEDSKLAPKHVRDELYLVHIRALMPLFYVKVRLMH